MNRAVTEMQIEKTILPKVAVLMATYNGEKFLTQQVDSILRQEGVEILLYVRDDGSTDTTISLLEKYRAENNNIFLLNTIPVQLKAAKNFMSMVRDIDFSEINYMAYCDQDDIWLPTKLSAAIAAIKKQQVDCYASNLLMGDAEAKLGTKKSEFKKFLSYIFNYKANTQQPYDFYFEAASAGCTLVLNNNAALYLQQMLTELFDRIPERASHDWSTYAITRLNGFKWYIDDHAYIIYRQHAENAYGANLGWGAVKKLLELFTSGWYRKHIIMIDELYNRTNIHPPFIDLVKNYQQASITSRFKMAFAVCGYRRKKIHRVMLFLLIIFGYCK